jgi:hypothetical protein
LTFRWCTFLGTVLPQLKGEEMTDNPRHNDAQGKDETLRRTISELVAAEHKLQREHVGSLNDHPDLVRLRTIEAELDQCWDLLRQRQALRDAGRDPDGAVARSIPTIEGYEQ